MTAGEKPSRGDGAEASASARRLGEAPGRLLTARRTPPRAPRRPSSPARLLFGALVGLSATGGCTLALSLDGYSGGSAPRTAPIDASTPEPTDATTTGVDAEASSPDTSVVSASAKYEASVLSDGPTAFWRLLDPGCAMTTCSNSARSQYAAIPPLSVQLVAGLFGGEGRAASFDATHVEPLVATDLPWPAGPFSIELWYRPSQAPDNEYRALVFQASGQQANPDMMVLYHFAPYGLVFERRESSTQHKLSVAFTQPLAAGTWHHVVGTYTPPSIVAMYVDAVPFTAMATDPSEPTNTVPFSIGGWGSSYSDGACRGALAEVAVYPSVISGARVTEHYELGRPGP